MLSADLVWLKAVFCESSLAREHGAKPGNSTRLRWCWL